MPGRPERPVDPGGGPAAQFASELSELRRSAGLTLDQLASLPHVYYDRSSLSKVTNGQRIPSWDITKAFVLGCGGDIATWEKRWKKARFDEKIQRASRGNAIVVVNPPEAVSERESGLDSQVSTDHAVADGLPQEQLLSARDLAIGLRNLGKGLSIDSMTRQFGLEGTIQLLKLFVTGITPDELARSLRTSERILQAFLKDAEGIDRAPRTLIADFVIKCGEQPSVAARWADAYGRLWQEADPASAVTGDSDPGIALELFASATDLVGPGSLERSSSSAPNPSRIETVEQLRDALLAVKSKAGLSFSDIERRTSRRLRRSAAHLLTTSTPAPQVSQVLEFLQACGIRADTEAWEKAVLRTRRNPSIANKSVAAGDPASRMDEAERFGEVPEPAPREWLGVPRSALGRFAAAAIVLTLPLVLGYLFAEVQQIGLIVLAYSISVGPLSALLFVAVLVEEFKSGSWPPGATVASFLIWPTLIGLFIISGIWSHEVVAWLHP